LAFAQLVKVAVHGVVFSTCKNSPEKWLYKK